MLDELGTYADLLLLAGDLTRHGTVEEARCVATEFGGLPVPVIAVLGNHDYHSDCEKEIVDLLTGSAITVLDGTSTTIDINGVSVGVAGIAGFGGGFAGRCISEFGEPETKAYAAHAREQAGRLMDAFGELDCDIRISLTHYAPVPDTLVGEPLEIYPFLGSYLLGVAIDDAAAHLAVHGHAHAGSPNGMTPGGVPVRNVAYPVLQKAYGVFQVTST
jgi:Icc-related predicted phosphoesterase